MIEFRRVPGRYGFDMERCPMQRTNLNIDKRYGATVRELAGLAIFLAGCFPAVTLAQPPGQKTFLSAEEASNSLVAAMQSKNEKALLEFLGPDGKQIISSGDEIEDLHTRADFVHRYLEMHRLVNEPDGTTVLYIGAGTGLRPYRSCTMPMDGISTPRQARGRSCIGE